MNDNWLVIATKPCQENRAELNLRRQPEIISEVYLPRVKIFGKIKALFPSYIFVKVANGNHNTRVISNRYGVRTVIRIGENLATVANDHIDEIREREASDGIIRLNPFNHGDPVKWGDIPAIFEEMVDDDRCSILFSMLGRETHKVLRLQDLAPVQAIV